ncbi:glycosyltransferase [Aliivibrio kagoshimensis]|uniref:glycosyltransferase n=1 Tax=Aliivibrio kagoshimensis TaxID=2910230 RepID=UPI003D10C8D1
MIRQRKKAILFIHFGENWIRGSERCLLDLMQHLPAHFQPILWCNQEKMQQEAKALGIKTYRSNLSSLHLIQNVLMGCDIVRQHRIRLVHANNAAPVWLSTLLARNFHLPMMVHLHSLYPLYQRWMFGLPLVSMAVGVSDAVTTQLLDDGFSPNHVTKISNGIDTQLLEFQRSTPLKKSLGLKQSDYLMVTVGSLIHRKGVDNLLHVLYLFAQEGRPIHLAILGEGPDKKKLMNLSKKLGISKRVHFCGEQTQVVAQMKNSADLFVSATREDVFGLVFTEAGVAKLPVVAPDVGGISEVVNHEHNGLLYKEGDIKQLYQSIKRCYLNPEFSRSLAHAGYRRAHQYFDIHRNASKMCAVYSQLLAPQYRQTAFNFVPKFHQVTTAFRRATQVLLRLTFPQSQPSNK